MGQLDQIGPNLGQIGPKQPILKVETQDFGSCMFLKVITPLSAYIKLLEPAPVTKWVKWTKLVKCLAKIGPNWAKTANFESRDPRLWVKYIFENNHYFQCIYQNTWAYNSDRMGQMDQVRSNVWSKLSKKAKLDMSTYFDHRDLPFWLKP